MQKISRSVLYGLFMLFLIASCQPPVSTDGMMNNWSKATVAAWAPNVAYKVGDVVSYQSVTYTCIQAHTSLTGWEPPNVPALWKAGTSAVTPTPTPTPSVTPTPTPVAGSVIFQNTGVLAGWDGTQPQNKGSTTQVTSPAYKGTALKHTQIYDPVYSQNSGYTAGYHAEVVKFGAQSVGQDYYYGQAIYLPADWVFHDQNDTFQQFSPENPSGPWTLNWIQNDHIWIRIAGEHIDLGTIQKATWTRIVVRLKLGNPGTFEAWVNGVKVATRTNANLDPNGSPTIRWSSGIYCTWWRNNIPSAGEQLVRTIYHSHLRIATTMQAADPANW